MIRQALCASALLVSPWREKSSWVKRYDKPTSAFTILCAVCARQSSHCSSPCRWHSEQQPTVIALCTPFHARCYATGGKDIPRKLIPQRFKRLEVFQFNYIVPGKKKNECSTQPFLCHKSTQLLVCDSSLLAYLLSRHACALSVKQNNTFIIQVSYNIILSSYDTRWHTRCSLLWL